MVQSELKILITGANGFVGKNLVAELRNKGYNNLYLFDIDTKPELLNEYTKDCDFIYHLAGVNRPQQIEEFMKGNFGFTSTLLESLKRNNNKSPIVITSSIQAELQNPYGESKRAGEDLMFDYQQECGVKVYVYRLPNLFGKWCKPNYNSAVATFCNNIANELPINVNDPSVSLKLVYIDDLVNNFITLLDGCELDILTQKFYNITTIHEVKLGEIVDLINSFKNSRITLLLNNFSDNSFEKKLYSTYLSYLPKDKFSYPLKMNVDNRGSFTEFLKTNERGQVSINISKPGITKGEHWHHTKNEKFLVVSGKGVIRFREIGSDEVIEYFVSGEKLEVVDIPVGYTHNIENLGDTDMVTVMWVNEIFNPEKPDTFFLPV